MSESPLFDETKDHLLIDGPVVPERNAWFDPPVQAFPTFTHDDGSVYLRLDPDLLDQERR